MVVPSPSAWTFADTEVCTNVAYAFDRTSVKSFFFELACHGTPSNNVQIAFGRDVDGDGALAPQEVALTVGWDVGEWFVRGPVDGLRFADSPISAGPSHSLIWNLHLDAQSRPRRFFANEGDGTLFESLSANPPVWFFDRSWNMVRLTARGVDAEVGNVSVAVLENGMIIRFR